MFYTYRSRHRASTQRPCPIEHEPNGALTRSCSGPAARTLVAPDPGAHYGGSRSHFLIYFTMRGRKIIVHRLPTNRELMRPVVVPPTLKKLADGYMSCQHLLSRQAKVHLCFFPSLGIEPTATEEAFRIGRGICVKIR